MLNHDSPSDTLELYLANINLTKSQPSQYFARLLPLLKDTITDMNDTWMSFPHLKWYFKFVYLFAKYLQMTVQILIGRWAIPTLTPRSHRANLTKLFSHSHCKSNIINLTSTQNSCRDHHHVATPPGKYGFQGPGKRKHRGGVPFLNTYSHCPVTGANHVFLS